MSRSLLLFCLLCCGSALMAGELAIKSGDSVVFLGDSITANSKGSGYVNLVGSGLKANGVEVKKINAGASGANSADLLKSCDSQIARKPKPALLLLSCGINDAKGYGNALPVEAFKTNITAIVDKTQAAGIRVLMLTTTALECHRPADRGMKKTIDNRNAALAPYNDFLRQEAVQTKCLLADINAEFLKALEQPAGAGSGLTANDGVHPVLQGNEIMARVVLTSLGFDKDQIAKAEVAWRGIAESESATKDSKPPAK